MVSKFISNKLRKELSTGNKFSKPIIKVAIVSITISMLVMLISISVVRGFQREIKNKVVNFSSHIQITSGGTNFSLETSPIRISKTYMNEVKNIAGVSHIQTFATKAGILQSNADTVVYDTETKVNRDIEGIIFKGLNTDFDWNFIETKLIEGKTFRAQKTEANDSILISNYLKKRLRLSVNDKIRGYFFNGKKPIVKSFVISGIYETGLEEFDNQFVFADIQHIQKLNSWGISTSLFLELSPKNEHVRITANSVGGNEYYMYQFQDDVLSFQKSISFCANKDTVIRVITNDYAMNTVTLKSEPVSIPDTAWLQLKVNSTNGECVTATGEFDYESINDSTRVYTGSNGTITTILRTTGGSQSEFIGGYEIYIQDFDKLDEMEKEISFVTDPFQKMSKVTDMESEIFGWLNVLDTNAVIIIVLMIMVAVINIAALLLVIIVEKISFIGIMKSFGSQDYVVQKVFINLGGYILGRGIIFGNSLAFLIIWLQSMFGFIKLPQEKYYLSEVPLGFEWTEFIIINFITICLALFILFITSLFIANIKPVKAIKFN